MLLAPVQADPTLGSIVTSALALLIGTQAATAKRLKVAEITTVVVTSTITGLASDSRLAGGKGTFWQRRALAIVLIMLGALAGAAALHVHLALALALAAVIATAVTVTGHVAHRRAEAAVKAGAVSPSLARD